MFEIIAVRGAFFDALCWDTGDKEIRGIYSAGKFDEELQPEDVYMLDIRLSGGLWRVYWASPRYDECPMPTCMEDHGDEAYGENCPLCQQDKKDLEEFTH